MMDIFFDVNNWPGRKSFFSKMTHSEQPFELLNLSAIMGLTPMDPAETLSVP